MILFIGDLISNTGPANVNKDYMHYLSGKVKFIVEKNKFIRLIKSLFYIFFAKTVIISGISQVNSYACIFSHLLKKKVIYLMHGCLIYEEKQNRFKSNPHRENMEKKMLFYADKIITVSEQFACFVQDFYPVVKGKVTYVNNGIEWSRYSNSNVHNRDMFMILSMGGGRPQKNNLVICKAVKILNEKYNLPFKFIVLGRDYADTEKIKKSPYTTYVGQIPYEDTLIWLRRAYIYVQNSSFEPFGLAAIEALCSGCNLLLSKNSGAISIFNSISESDIIDDCHDAEEIANKIRNIYNNPNNNRLLSGIDKERTSCKFSSNKIYEIACSME